jgi:hypothetical protein
MDVAPYKGQARPETHFGIPENYQAMVKEQLPLIMLKLVVGCLCSNQVDMNEIKDACDDYDAKVIIHSILQQIEVSKKAGLEAIKIDLKEKGKFKLENHDKGMVIKKWSEDSGDSDEVLAILVGRKLERLLGNFEFDGDIEDWLLDGVFVQKFPPNQHPMLKDTPNNSKPQPAEPLPSTSDSELDSWDDDSVLIEKSPDSSDAVPKGDDGIDTSYLQTLITKTKSEDSTLGSGIFEEAFKAFVYASNDINFVNVNQVVMDDFVIYNQVIQGEDNAKQFISMHREDDVLILVPYGVTNRAFGLGKLGFAEDHLVLLAIRGKETAIIDPKWGVFLGDVATWEDTKQLSWQEDTHNCGFFVYHMLIKAIAASKANQWKTGGALSSDLGEFFKQLPKPTPKGIRAEMFKICEPMLSQRFNPA